VEESVKLALKVASASGTTLFVNFFFESSFAMYGFAAAWGLVCAFLIWPEIEKL
jgi:hypothetical protein